MQDSMASPFCCAGIGRSTPLFQLMLALLSLAACGAVSDTLNKGGTIRAPGSLVSGGGGVARLQVVATGGCADHCRGQSPWASGTNGHSGVHLDLQGDGNLVLYSTIHTCFGLATRTMPKSLSCRVITTCALHNPEHCALGVQHEGASPLPGRDQGLHPRPAPPPSPSPSPSPSPRPAVVPIIHLGAIRARFIWVHGHPSFL